MYIISSWPFCGFICSNYIFRKSEGQIGIIFLIITKIHLSAAVQNISFVMSWSIRQQTTLTIYVFLFVMLLTQLKCSNVIAQLIE